MFLYVNIDQNRNIGGGVALAMAELAYFFKKNFCSGNKKIQATVILS